MPRKNIFYFFIFVASCAAFLGLSLVEKHQYTSTDRRLKILSTTGMIGDIVKNIVRDRGEQTTLMKAGVDPHTYEATVQDAWALENADIIFFNGLNFEGEIHHNLEMLGRYKPVYAVSDALAEEDLLADPNFPTGKDPHIFWDVENWIKVTRFVTDQLKEHDTENAEFYEKNAEKYIQELWKLDAEIKKAFEVVPEEERILVTSHDAFSYLGRRYQITIKSLQGISTVTEASAHQRIAIKYYILDHRLQAIFVEYSVNPKGIEALQQDCHRAGHKLACFELYSDTLGEEGTPEATYVGALRYNIKMIIKGLAHDKKDKKSSY